MSGLAKDLFLLNTEWMDVYLNCCSFLIPEWMDGCLAKLLLLLIPKWMDV
jgi:hypothetical protein